MILKKQSKAFTFIEMLIVISLLLLLVTFTYLPYSHYQQKIKIKQVIREWSQTLIETRNLAINWYDELNEISWDIENRSMGVYFSVDESEHTNAYIISFPFSMVPADAANLLLTDPSVIRPRSWKKYPFVRPLPSWTQYESIAWEAKWALFFYEAISGDGTYFALDWVQANEIWQTKIDLEFSYKDSNSPVLRKKFLYDRRIHTIDYGIGVID